MPDFRPTTPAVTFDAKDFLEGSATIGWGPGVLGVPVLAPLKVGVTNGVTSVAGGSNPMQTAVGSSVPALTVGRRIGLGITYSLIGTSGTIRASLTNVGASTIVQTPFRTATGSITRYTEYVEAANTATVSDGGIFIIINAQDIVSTQFWIHSYYVNFL